MFTRCAVCGDLQVFRNSYVCESCIEAAVTLLKFKEALNTIREQKQQDPQRVVRLED